MPEMFFLPVFPSGSVSVIERKQTGTCNCSITVLQKYGTGSAIGIQFLSKKSSIFVDLRNGKYGSRPNLLKRG